VTKTPATKLREALDSVTGVSLSPFTITFAFPNGESVAYSVSDLGKRPLGTPKLGAACAIRKPDPVKAALESCST
jgi:hypothetical protein